MSSTTPTVSAFMDRLNRHSRGHALAAIHFPEQSPGFMQPIVENQPHSVPNLQALPIEVHHEIGKYLNAYWLVQLTQTCKSLRESFSFHKGNKIWYLVYPPALYQERERFQWDTEIHW